MRFISVSFLEVVLVLFERVNKVREDSRIFQAGSLFKAAVQVDASPAGMAEFQ